ncbi:MAG TPA: hypothetical protein VIF64_20075 [Pyrinomonadaceae bacterium]|jgi:hypothetical protein
MKIPDKPYVALYGSHSGNWREACIKLLSHNNLLWYDPSDQRWSDITNENGDQMQPLINRLVAKEQRGLMQARCVVFHLSHPVASSATRRKRARETRNDDENFLAARCELGFLIGRGIPTFVHIDSDVEGRNYLWAAIKISPSLIRCRSLLEATKRAIQYMKD